MFIKNWPEDGSLEPKHVANYVLMITCMLCLTKQITLSSPLLFIFKVCVGNGCFEVL